MHVYMYMYIYMQNRECMYMYVCTDFYGVLSLCFRKFLVSSRRTLLKLCDPAFCVQGLRAKEFVKRINSKGISQVSWSILYAANRLGFLGSEINLEGDSVIRRRRRRRRMSMFMLLVRDEDSVVCKHQSFGVNVLREAFGSDARGNIEAKGIRKKRRVRSCYC